MSEGMKKEEMQFGAHASWTEADEEWLKANVKEQLHATARRYGKACFQFTMQMGICAFCFTNISQAARHDPKLTGFINTILNSYNDLAKVALEAKSIPDADFRSCKEDVERIGALLDTGAIRPGMRVSKGGIILDS